MLTAIRVQILDEAVGVLFRANSLSTSDNRSGDWPEGSIFKSYNTEV